MVTPIYSFFINALILHNNCSGHLYVCIIILKFSSKNETEIITYVFFATTVFVFFFELNTMYKRYLKT